MTEFSSLSLLAWSLPSAAAIHIFEEFVFPGGFKAWWQAYRPGTAGSVSTRFLVIINAALLFLCANVALALRSPRGNGVAVWLTVAALLFSNAIFHIIGAFQTGRYSPGMISGIILYMPLALIGYYWFLQTGRASPATAIIAALIGGSYHFIAFANHRRRTRAKVLSQGIRES